MAGTIQHILPKFLLKGFASRIQKKEVLTWVYRKDKPPFETNIKNIGAERNFYGKEGKLSVDPEITDFEGKYAPLLDELRAIRKNQEIYDPRIANFITHLAIRTKHIREFFRESSEFIIERMSDFFSIIII